MIDHGDTKGYHPLQMKKTLAYTSMIDPGNTESYIYDRLRKQLGLHT